MSQQFVLTANETNLLLSHTARTEASRLEEIFHPIMIGTNEDVLGIFVSLASPVLKACTESGEAPAEGCEGQGLKSFAFQGEAEEAGLQCGKVEAKEQHDTILTLLAEGL